MSTFVKIFLQQRVTITVSSFRSFCDFEMTVDSIVETKLTISNSNNVKLYLISACDECCA